MIRQDRNGEYEFYDIAPKTTDGRTFEGEDALYNARKLATVLLMSRGACVEEAANMFGCEHRQAYRRAEEARELADCDDKFEPSGQSIDEIRNACIVLMSECDYTELDLADIWDLSPSRIREIVGTPNPQA